MAVALPAGADYVVGGPNHVPVIWADNSFVVIAEGLPSYLGEKAEGGVYLYPGLVDVE